MADTTSEIRIEARPYKPSWIDRFTDWVANLPIRAWIFYVACGIGLIVIQLFFLWLDGGLQAEELLPVIIYNGFAVPYLLALIHLFDLQAVTALNSMRPTLAITEPEFDDFEFRLSTTPSRPAFIAGLATVAFLVIAERLWTAPVRYAPLERLPVFAVVNQVFDKGSGFLFGVFIYHTIRQLRLVNAINSKHIRINLFDLRPLQAFSRLTASTAVGLAAAVYGWMLINPDLLTDPVSLGFAGLSTILAVAVFVWPLFGVHRLMEIEKERALHDIDLRFEAAFSKFNQRFREDDFSAVEVLDSTISSLEIQDRRVRAIHTWPWRPETARFALTAVALPLVLTVLQFLVEQALG